MRISERHAPRKERVETAAPENPARSGAVRYCGEYYSERRKAESRTPYVLRRIDPADGAHVAGAGGQSCAIMKDKMRRARRYLPLLAIFLLGGIQVTAAVASAMQIQCVETCPDDDDTGHCPPSCGCACHAPFRLSTVHLKIANLDLRAERCVAEEASVPASPDPKPLRHVPKNAA